MEGIVIYGGDSNIAFDEGLDKNCPLGRELLSPTRQSLNVARQIYHLGLVDIWREVNPTRRDYMHFSHPHNSFVRFDHFFLAATDIPLVLKSYIRGAGGGA